MLWSCKSPLWPELPGRAVSISTSEFGLTKLLLWSNKMIVDSDSSRELIHGCDVQSSTRELDRGENMIQRDLLFQDESQMEQTH